MPVNLSHKAIASDLVCASISQLLFIKNTTVSFDCGEWYVSIQVEMQQDIAEHPGAGNIIGLDIGVKSFVTSSDGQHIMALGSFRKLAHKSLLDQAWYQFRQILTYKQEWLGGLVIVVPAPYTSQRCSACEKISAASRKSQWEFVCVYCGYSDHADINAAKNIKATGSAVLACRDISPVRVSAQESPPLGARVSR